MNLASYKTRVWISFFAGLILILSGMPLIFSGDNLKENFGFILFSLGGIFWGIMAGIKFGADSTKDITKNVIDILILQGIISSDSGIRINENLQVVQPVSAILACKYDIEKSDETSRVKTDVYVTQDGITVYPDGTLVDRKGTIIKMGSNYRL